MGDFGRRSPSPGKFSWRPFWGQGRPKRARRRQAREPSDAGAFRRAKGARGAEPAGPASERSRRGFGLPVVCVRERASSNRSGQVEATKIKSDLPVWRSTPPPPWFDPRPGCSEPRRAQPRLQADARYCQRKGAAPTPLPPVARTWEPSSQGGEG